jgi:hypothetical protein
MLQEGGAADAAAPLKAAIFNIGANVNLPLLETTERVFRKDATVKERLLRNTEQSVARGTFGAPMFLVGDLIYFGNDRLCDAEEAIRTSWPMTQSLAETPKWSASCAPVKPPVKLCGSSGSIPEFHSFHWVTSRS